MSTATTCLHCGAPRTSPAGPNGTGLANDPPDVEREIARYLKAHPRATVADAYRTGWARMALRVGPTLIEWERRWWDGVRVEQGLRSKVGVLLSEVSRLRDRGLSGTPRRSALPLVSPGVEFHPIDDAPAFPSGRAPRAREDGFERRDHPGGAEDRARLQEPDGLRLGAAHAARQHARRRGLKRLVPPRVLPDCFCHSRECTRTFRGTGTGAAPGGTAPVVYDCQRANALARVGHTLTPA